MNESNSFQSRITLDRALMVHSSCKRRLQEAMINQEHLDVATIRRDDCCELGIWIKASGSATFGHLPEFQNLINSHQEFHAVAGIVADLINTGERSIAETMLISTSQFTFASMEVAVAINALKRAATQK